MIDQMTNDGHHAALVVSSSVAVSEPHNTGVLYPASAEERLARCDSYQRAHGLFLAMAGTRSPRERVALFLEWGNACDAPWPYRSYIADMLRRALNEVPLRDMLRLEERRWFDSMAPLVQVYRGCEAGRVRGLSWTTDVGVARKFAAGQRCVNARPTLASAIIPREHVLALFLDRGEREVIVDPRRLRQVTSGTLEERYRWEHFVGPVPN